MADFGRKAKTDREQPTAISQNFEERVETRFYRWDQDGGADKAEPAVGGYLHVHLSGYNDWDLRAACYYQVWTKDNLLFCERRPHMLGTFRDVQRAVLDCSRIGEISVFRLWGWEVMVVIRGDVKSAIERAGITGCRFSLLETI